MSSAIHSAVSLYNHSSYEAGDVNVDDNSLSSNEHSNYEDSDCETGSSSMLLLHGFVVYVN